MAQKPIFNPLTGQLDYVEQDISLDASKLSTAADGYFALIEDGSGNGVVSFWLNGHRFKLTGTLDDPVGGSRTYGLLLSLAIT